MRAFTLLSSLVITASAFKFHGKLPHNDAGKPLSHQAPKLNLELTGAISIDASIKKRDVNEYGKRRLSEPYIPTEAQMDAIKHDFEGYVPEGVVEKRDAVK